MEQMDILQTSLSELRHDSLDALEITLDLGDLSLSGQVSETFDDLIGQERYQTGNLFPLRKCRHVLREGGTLRLTNTHPGAHEVEYQELQTLLLRSAGFTDMAPIGESPPFVIEARKRPAMVEEQEFGMIVREIMTPEDLALTHEFAREYYFYKDFNYDLDVSRQFDLHTDVFAMYDKSGQIVALARNAMRVPGYNCPFMHAATDDGSHYVVPDRFRRIGEMMAIYKEGRDGVVGFKRLMEFLTQYIAYVACADSIWTTNDVTDPYTGNYYKSKFLMYDVGVRLTYRNFGGKWNVLCTERVQELGKLHRELFRR
jgi:hypothetical protein